MVSQPDEQWQASIKTMHNIYRILDANFNRAREALRVIEDFVRFILDDASIAASAKQLRSRLQKVAESFPAEALLSSRNTLGDVGTTITSQTEPERADALAVATAACKRLTEALRTLEEYSKVIAEQSVAEFESMRYAAYDLEKRLAVHLMPSKRFEKVRLYVLLTSSLCRADPIDTARAVIEGGADCIQIREKEMSDRQIVLLAQRLKEITAPAGVLLIINDRPDIAAVVGADGVHLGQDDLSVRSARSLLPAGMIIGQSTHNIVQARTAVEDGADYIAVGPIFPTKTKDAGSAVGVDFLKQVACEIPLPHVAIGGITADNVDQVVSAEGRCVGVCSAVISADDPAAVARLIKKKITRV